jgi:hypothetical protein
MWPSKPLNVAYNDPYLLCFSERGIDVFHVKTGDWIQILQFSKTKPLDKSGSLCLCNESPDSIRLIHFKAIGEEETISLVTKTRSLVKSKLRKASLSRSDETYLTLSNNSTSSAGHQQQTQPIMGGSTALNYSNSTASSSGASNSNSNSRKSLISNPINFQHLQHMGPNDGKTFMSEPPTLVQPSTSSVNATGASVPSNGGRVLNVSSLNNTSLLNEQLSNENYYKVPNNQTYSQPPTSKTKSNSTSGARQIAKQEISAPTNFRHVVKGLEELGSLTSSKELIKPHQFNTTASNVAATAGGQQQQQQQQQLITGSASSNNNGSKSSIRQSSSLASNTAGDTQASLASNIQNVHHHHHHPHQSQQQQQTYIKTSSLSSSSSSSSSILHSPNSPSLSNNENLSHAINNTLKANSVLYNGKQVE